MQIISSTKPILIYPYNFRMEFSISDHCIFSLLASSYSPLILILSNSTLFPSWQTYYFMWWKNIYTWLSLLERFPPPLSLISSFLQGSVLKQNTSLMHKIRNSCLSYYSTRYEAVLDQAVLDSNRPIYICTYNQK